MLKDVIEILKKIHFFLQKVRTRSILSIAIVEWAACEISEILSKAENGFNLIPI